MWFSTFLLLFFRLILLFTFFLGETKKYGHYRLLWMLNGYDSAWKTQCLLNMLFKHYCGSYFGWNYIFVFLTLKTWKMTGNKELLFFFFLLQYYVTVRCTEKSLLSVGWMEMYFKWRYTAKRCTSSHISIYVLLIGLSAKNCVYSALMCSL